MTTAPTTKPTNEYLEKRIRRIARNEQRLKELGFVKKKVTTKPKKVVVRRKIHFEPTRRSTRGTGKVLLEMLSYQHDSDAISVKQEEKELPQTPPPEPKFTERRRYRVQTTTQVKPLTAAQGRLVEKLVGDSNFLDLFETYLVRNDKISDQNLRSVMRQVRKLANGEGIRYESPRYGWPEGKYFRKGFKISPSDDFVELMMEAEECENEWGRDRGNGWLLSHPLKKLLNFQQFVLVNQDAFSGGN
mmetsp:Transcript_22317/g.32945  ORF Transcript_22317/g.32945 Transcript_22317/m.32945 type:complete len:245 (+) Transcript_22317:82-816(+)|eukprot:CAMPEP_0194213714 /NCGR_PEP_ID=MMETSP0156-20130528/14500_1 /TAXON_ID=33649 /ORGANISM="Thalassionema nitzschioides, Strain L26-B" /LENGTH=244 /DNA_ID=CAMNT_0038941811 /DNA_START=55 /DNA_END=789 /DNA_ORIENTATION=-